MVAIKNALFFISAASALILPRDFSTVRNDLTQIDTDTKALTSAVNAYDGSGNKALAVNSAADTLNSKINATITDVNNAAPVTGTQAQDVLDFINNTLEPDVKTSLAATKAKKAQFTSGGLKSIVQSKIATLRKSASDLGAALKAKAPSDKQAAAQSTRDKIDADFADAVAFYAS